MKKFGLLVAGGIAALILLSTIGPMVGLARKRGASVLHLQAVFKD